MKKCNKCLQTKSLDQFHKRGKGHQPWCKSCKKKDDKIYYDLHKEKWNSYNKEWKKEFWNWYKNLKTEPCSDCKNTYDPVVMDWDHKPDEIKIQSIADIARSCNKEKVLTEIVKCELVCANCHRLRTSKRLKTSVLILEES